MVVLMPALLLAALNGVVLQPVANMHSQPAEDSGVVSQAIFGANVGILEERDGWLKIRTADEYTGWAQAEAVRRGPPYALSGRVAHVDSLFAHVYREPSVTKRRPQLTVPFETRLETLAEEESWIQVRLPDGSAGWIQRGDVTFEPPRLEIDGTIALAKRFLGLPYTWGGASSFGFDCSGFMQMLARRRGIGMPRDSRPQAQWSGAAAVEKAALLPGDLLYFGKGPDRINHTGLYIGAGEFIHATSHERPMVQISRLDDPHWTASYVCARRLK
jgi:hypothetical protein